MKYRIPITLLYLCIHMQMTAGEPIVEPAELDDNDIQELNTVVVTGTRTLRDANDTPILTQVISAEEIQKADATNIQDLLQTELAGVEFTYAMNQQVNLNHSGFSGQNILFLIDGEPIAGETLDNIDFTRLTCNDVERIEIVRGAVSARYGSSATGGVINIITKKPQKDWTLHLDARYGQHNAQRYNMLHSLKQGIYGHNISFSRTSSDNYSVNNHDNNAQTRTYSEVYGDNTWAAKYNLYLDVRPSFRIAGRIGYFRRNVERTTDISERYHDYNSGLKCEWDITDSDHLEISYSFDQYDKSRYQYLTNLDIREYSNVKNNTRLIYHHNFEKGNILTIGADYLYDFINSKNIDGKHHQQNTDIYAQYDWRITPKWEIVSALRYDYFSAGSLSRVSPKVSVCWRPSTGLTLRSSYGMGFRAPTLKEKYYNFDMAGIWIVEGNPELKAESSHSINISGEYTLNNWHFTLSYYYNRVSDRITTGIPYYKYENDKQLYLGYINLENIDVHSVEATASARWTCGIGMKLAYTYSHEETQSKTTNPYMPTRPHSMVARFDWDRQFNKDWGMNVALSGRAQSGINNTEYVNMYDITSGTKTIRYDGYTLWKLQATVRWKWGEIRGTIDNLLNFRPKYYYYNTPPTTGINGCIGLSIDIENLCASR